MDDEIQHPALKSVADQRLESLSLRVADRITKFAGSMTFVYVHAALFVLWILVFGIILKVDRFPFNFLTMTVSLEAIFLSTFVMIGQNRQADMAQAKAEHDFIEQEQELKANTAITDAVHTLTKDMHPWIEALHRHLIQEDSHQ